MLENNKNDLDELNGEFEFEVENKEALDKLFYGANQEYIERQKRFAEGTYTEDDLLNHCPRFGIGTKDKIELELVEQKYFDKLASLYTNLKEIEKLHQEENGKLRKEIKELEEIKADYIRRMKTSNEVLLKQGYISKDKIKKTQGELCMQLGSYVQNEASPEQERIAGGINIINKILEEK